MHGTGAKISHDIPCRRDSHLLQARRPTARSSIAVAIPSLATAPSTMPVAGAASVLWNRLPPRFLTMGYPPAERPPSLNVTGSRVAGAFCWLLRAAGSSTSTPAEAVTDLQAASPPSYPSTTPLLAAV